MIGRSGLHHQILVASLLAFSSQALAQTTLNPGDIAIVAINANNTSCSGVTAEDEITFLCFKSIAVGTRIWITDCGYEKLNATQWGDGEGVFQITRTTSALAAGTLVTFRASQTGVITFTNPDANWSYSNLNASGQFNMNSGGDQIFFLQPNTSPAGAYSNPAGADNATFTNCRILYGFSTVAPPNDWVSFQNSTQRSGLPPGMICFSMAPSVGSDFIKYIGPTGYTWPTYPTFYQQRDWIIDIDDNTRWSNFASCSAYAAGAPNYAAGGVFTVVAGGFVNGRWTGAKNADWFDCRNWDDASVPTSTSPVVVDPLYQKGLAQNPTIGVSPSPPTAYCNSLQVSSAGAAKMLTIQNAGVLQVGGNITVTKTAINAALGVTVTSGSVTANNLTLTGLVGGYSAIFRNEVPANTVQFNGGITINPGGDLDLQGAGAGGVVSLTGNFTNNADAVAFEDLYSTVIFNGSGPQSISTAGFTDDFHSITVTKSSNDLSLNAAVNVRSLLNLTTGRVMTTSMNILTLANTGSVANASDASFVHGPMIKVGPLNFTFPVGKNTRIHPASITNITAGATDAFIGEYFASDPTVDIGVPVEMPALDHVSSCEYWRIDQYVGTPVGKVTLSWKAPTSCGVTNLTDLRVAHWDGTMWRDRGNGGASGTVLLGTLPTAAAQETLFSPGGYWTLASHTAQNPLPIELMYFMARPDGLRVKLDWATASERDNDHFTVERSANGVDFEEVLRRAGAGNSTSTIDYTDVDPWPLAGVSYYRLRQTDVDGTSTLSDIVAVRIDAAGGNSISVVPDHGGLLAVHGFGAGSTVEVMDMMGRIIWQERSDDGGRTALPIGSWSPGAYVVRVSNGDRSASTRFAF